MLKSSKLILQHSEGIDLLVVVLGFLCTYISGSKRFSTLSDT